MTFLNHATRALRNSDRRGERSGGCGANEGEMRHGRTTGRRVSEQVAGWSRAGERVRGGLSTTRDVDPSLSPSSSSSSIIREQHERGQQPCTYKQTETEGCMQREEREKGACKREQQETHTGSTNGVFVLLWSAQESLSGEVHRARPKSLSRCGGGGIAREQRLERAGGMCL